MDNDINYEGLSLGPGGHIKGKNAQSEGGSSPEEGGGGTLAMTFLSIFFQNRIFSVFVFNFPMTGERAREDKDGSGGKAAQT